MKQSLFLPIVIALSWAACKNDPGGVQEIRGGGPNSELVRNPATANMPTDTNQLARITFDQPEFEFGTVDEGTVVEHVFKFTNTGKVPLTILKARSSCGCTVPEWPEEPIPPGGTGEIKAKFNTEGKLKEQKKSITVTANTYPNDTKIFLKGMVNPVKG
ncbi:MAG: DUF1573 domain-containing protein [Saprospiraceae bacterium]